MRERLSALPVSELREIAKANGIKSVTTLRKQQLIDMIIETAERKDAESNSVEKSGEEAKKVSKKERKKAYAQRAIKNIKKLIEEINN